MDIRAEEITKIIREQLGGFTAGVDVSEVGTVLSVGDGIARIHGLERCMAGELLELPHGVMGIALNLEEDSVGAVLMGEVSADPRGRRGEAHPAHHVRPRGRGHGGPGGERPRPAHRRQGPHRHRGLREPIERIAPGVVDRQPVREPLETGIKAIDCHGQHRPRPARADHRRPPDRQDRHRPRHDHQPEGQGRHLHLRGHRPEAVDGGPGGEDPRGLRGHGAHHRGLRHRLRARAPPLHRPLRGLRHRRVLPRPRPARALHLRRPLEARRGLSRDLAPPAPAARDARPTRATSSTSTAACSSARPSSRTRRAAAVSHRHSHHRDAGRRHLRLHPDQRHLDHRRPDLPGVRPLQLRDPPRDQRRQLGVAAWAARRR